MHVITRKMIARIHPLSVNAVRLWLSAIVMALLPQSHAAFSKLQFEAIGLTVIAAFFGPFLGRAALMYTARYIPAAQAVMLSLMTPFVALLLAAAFLGIWPKPMELFGGGLVLFGIVWPLSEGLRPARPEPDASLS
jgi:drug/metabolite transporter (DMT)-like permease